MPLNQPSGEMTASATGGPEAAVSRDVSEARSAAALERPRSSAPGLASLPLRATRATVCGRDGPDAGTLL
jgi:hypothetical protein